MFRIPVAGFRPENSRKSSDVSSNSTRLPRALGWGSPFAKRSFRNWVGGSAWLPKREKVRRSGLRCLGGLLPHNLIFSFYVFWLSLIIRPTLRLLEKGCKISAETVLRDNSEYGGNPDFYKICGSVSPSRNGMYGCKKIMASCMRLTERRPFRELANRHHPNPVRRVGVPGISAVIGAIQGNTRTIKDCAGVCDSLCITLRRDRDSNPRSLSAQRFSRPPQSTTLPSLRGQK